MSDSRKTKIRREREAHSRKYVNDPTTVRKAGQRDALTLEKFRKLLSNNWPMDPLENAKALEICRPAIQQYASSKEPPNNKFTLS